MLHLKRSGAGTDLRALPTRKCPGVSTSIPWSDAELSGVKGRLLRTDSTVTGRIQFINKQVMKAYYFA